MAIRGHLKAPTADAARGLGTGRPDEGVALEVSRTLGRGFALMTDAGYTFMGKPAGFEFRNAWWYDAGVAQDFAEGVMNVSIFFEAYRSVVSNFPDARDLLLTLGLKSADVGGFSCPESSACPTALPITGSRLARAADSRCHGAGSRSRRSGARASGTAGKPRGVWRADLPSRIIDPQPDQTHARPDGRCRRRGAGHVRRRIQIAVELSVRREVLHMALPYCREQVQGRASSAQSTR